MIKTLLLDLTLGKILSMGRTLYGAVFDEATVELGKLLQHRAKINERIAELRDIVIALAKSVGQDKERKERIMRILTELSVFVPRLTDAVKDALYTAGSRKLPAIQVKELMEDRGFDFSNFTNPLASVHSTLRRLAAQDAIASGMKNDTTVYWWNGPHFGGRDSLANMLADREQARRMRLKIGARVERELQRAGLTVVRP